MERIIVPSLQSLIQNRTNVFMGTYVSFCVILLYVLRRPFFVTYKFHRQHKIFFKVIKKQYTISRQFFQPKKKKNKKDRKNMRLWRVLCICPHSKNSHESDNKYNINKSFHGHKAQHSQAYSIAQYGMSVVLTYLCRPNNSGILHFFQPNQKLSVANAFNAFFFFLFLCVLCAIYRIAKIAHFAQSASSSIGS